MTKAQKAEFHKASARSKGKKQVKGHKQGGILHKNFGIDLLPPKKEKAHFTCAWVYFSARIYVEMCISETFGIQNHQNRKIVSSV